MYLLQRKADSREMRLWSEREIISSRLASRRGCKCFGIFLYNRLPRTRIIGQVPAINMSRTALSNSLWNVLITGSEPLARFTAQSRHGSITLLFVQREQRKPCTACPELGRRNCSRRDMLPKYSIDRKTHQFHLSVISSWNLLKAFVIASHSG